jgi:hypothetical protein
MRARSCQRTRSRKQLQRAMPTARAEVLLAVVAHGIGKHRRAAQSRFQNSIQVHASSASTTPAMPSTMLNHVDIEFVTSTKWLPEVDVRSCRRPVRHRLDSGPGSVGARQRGRGPTMHESLPRSHSTKCVLVPSFRLRCGGPNPVCEVPGWPAPRSAPRRVADRI